MYVCCACCLECLVVTKFLKVKSPVLLPKQFSGSGQLSLPSRWWTSLNNPALSKTIELALQRNLDLRAAWARLRQSRALATRNKSGLFPSISYSANSNAGVNEKGFLGSAQFGIAVNYEVDLWSRIRSGFRASTWDALAAKEAIKTVAISISADVATLWYQMSERLAQLQLLKRQSMVNKKTLTLVTTRFRMGQATAVDVLQQRQLVESLQGEREQVLSQYKLLRHQMATLLGQEPSAPQLTPPPNWKKLPALPATGIPAALVRQRPDVRAAFLQVKAAHHRVAEAVADQFPRLTLSADASGAARTFGNFVGNWVASLAAGLLGPIFDGWRRSAEVRRRKAIAEESLQLYGRAILIALREVEDALVRGKYQRRLLTSQQKQLKLMRAVIERAQFNYINGANSFLRVLDATRNFQTLERTHLASRRDLVLIRILLCRALAGGWKMTEPKTKRLPRQDKVAKGVSR